MPASAGPNSASYAAWARYNRARQERAIFCSANHCAAAVLDQSGEIVRLEPRRAGILKTDGRKSGVRRNR
jgi:hypothetical protein